MTLGTLDIAVVAVYFVLVAAVGLLAGAGKSDTRDYFLGGRRQNWFLVGLSVLATEVSALTFLAVPGNAFEGNWWYLQLYAGAFAGKLLISYVLLPAFYGGDVTTVYEYLGRRFGPMTRTTGSLMFFASRLLGSGVRLLAASLALAIVFDWPLHWVVLLGGFVAIAYATYGGIRAIIYTDALQALVLVGSGIAAMVLLFVMVPGDWSSNLSSLLDGGKLKVYHGGWDLSDDAIGWILVIHATVQTMAAMGVDQDLTQRMLTCPDVRRAQRSLLFNAIVGFPIPALFLTIGSLLFLFGQSEAAGGFAQEPPRGVFAEFIATHVPTGWGLKGLLLAGIFAAAMSSLDSALGALSSSAVTDIYRPFFRPHAPESHYMSVARWSTFGFGLLLVIIALMFQHDQNLLKTAFKYVSLVFGGMLGIFLVGVLTDRGDDRTNVVAMLTSIGVLVVIRNSGEDGAPLVAWPWWVIIGAAWTFCLAALFPGPGRNVRSRFSG